MLHKPEKKKTKLILTICKPILISFNPLFDICHMQLLFSLLPNSHNLGKQFNKSDLTLLEYLSG